MEPDNVVDGMVKSLKNMIYPLDKFEIIVVDDSNPKAMMKNYELFRTLNHNRVKIRHFWRSERTGYRGGALNFALYNSSSDYIVVLDIDHWPLPCMLYRLASAAMHSDNDVIMFPQVFRNWNKNSITLASYIGYRYDYSFSRKGKTVTNSAFCVGTNWIGHRRKIVESGGFYDKSIVEDMATGMLKWHTNGIKIGMIDDILAYGLNPETISAFKKQQYRWSKGAFELFPKLISNINKYSVMQFFDYFFNIAWYLVGLTLILSCLFPLFSILGVDFLAVDSLIGYFINVVVYTLLQVLLYATPLIIVGEPAKRVFKGQAIGIVIAGTYFKALIDTVLGFKIPFIITPKGKKRTGFFALLREAWLPMFLLYLNVLVGLIAAANLNVRNIITAFWAMYNSSWLVTAMYALAKDIYRSNNYGKKIISLLM